MKQRIDLKCESSKEWVDTVMSDFNAFLQDHANCERKASSMAMSFVAKFPDRLEIIPELINTGVEELEHFRDVYKIMEERGVELPHEIGKDHYVADLINLCRSGKEDRFMDRLLLASLVETRGAERFRLIYEALPEGDLKKFYHRLWASEARHGEIFVDMALQYFEKEEVYNRLEQMSIEEAKILQALPLKAALH
ncbi:tRNA-(ms[2]io[6]A)-hydroxylase [Marivirga atlantica]|jgi:tRNA-(ms[2]io[6]A)-hydroxylase|uniref:tRNA-(Ms[2]io[6]A)-hydroxylase n=1 Tax=Marivirga atlantica TaxID=1548457 RepID=A0A937AAP5_9BACT|nr:tRNA-(ms[2]io[6]A)-hydroxylase [Marivirga atlantica]MBL0766957.1 tRNA-(ms[2]io[6]A)-hydroxylase [Marivirga atlantica]